MYNMEWNEYSPVAVALRLNRGLSEVNPFELLENK
jgi:hypothetical protein